MSDGATALEVLGPAFVAYVCGGVPDSHEPGPQLAQDIRSSASDVLEQLDEMVRAVVQQAQQKSLPLSVALSSLWRFIPEAETTLPNVLRLQSGQELPEVPQLNDPLATDLIRRARDIFPTLL